MSHKIIRTALVNGSKNLLLHVYLESDGVEGELTNHVLLDPEFYDPPFTQRPIQPKMKLVVSQVWWNFAWFDALLAFDGVVPSPSWVLPRDQGPHVDFRHFGGIADRLVDPNTAVSTDRTGKLLLSTSGFAEAGSIGTMVIEIKKNLVA